MSAISILLKPHLRDLGGFSVRRVLPSLAHRSVGPFIFFDHVGPARFPAGTGIDVRPHPHIGLATVTYLFGGALLHRDSLGSVQRIEPGDVNWMIAGRGIVHSERTPEAERPAGPALHGIQTWVALPAADEDCEPSFVHHGAHTLPRAQHNGVSLHVIAGDAFGMRSPVVTFSRMLYVSAVFDAGSHLDVPPEHEQRSVYLVDGELDVDGTALEPTQMAVLDPGIMARLSSTTGARVMLTGGAQLDGERFINWNFVSSSRDKIERARQTWRAQTMGKVPGETEWIPLPER
ncbi:hypothetical protein DFQ28_007857 [Apophysomyces sp. BC1034]|nr:hypothetical protein DFQ28_007857 [Apophysomyces sp. BC1034]